MPRRRGKYRYSCADLARLAGVSLRTVYADSQRRKLNPESLESVHRWLTSRRPDMQVEYAEKYAGKYGYVKRPRRR